MPLDPASGIDAILAASQIDFAEWPIRIGRFSTTSDKSLAIMEQPGSPPEVKIPIDYPSIQILIRGSRTGYQEARDLAQAVFDHLQAIDSAPQEYPELTSCVASTGIGFIGYDKEQERPIFTLNFRLIVTHAPTNNRDL